MKTKTIFKIILLLVITNVATGYISWNRALVQNQAKVFSFEETIDILNNVSEIIVLPKDETPELVQMTKADQVSKEQPFFVDAKNGDIFIAYAKAKKAIIYRPSENIIVNVGPIYDNSNNGEVKKEEININTSTTSSSIPINSVDKSQN